MRENEVIPKMSRTAEFGREQEQSLKRMKLFATSLLVLMAVVYWVSLVFESRYPFLGAVAAFSGAGTIGALADWFAVVALFRHPLNLPIPRTAVIPRNRDRIGESLARFIRENFFAKDLLEKRMAAVDPAGFLAAWLSDEHNARFIAKAAAEYIPSLLGQVTQKDDPGGPGSAHPPGTGLSTFFYGIAEAVRHSPFMRKATAGLFSGLDRILNEKPGSALPGPGSPKGEETPATSLSLYRRALATTGYAVSGVRRRLGHPLYEKLSSGAGRLLGNARPDDGFSRAEPAAGGDASTGKPGDDMPFVWKVVKEKLIRDLRNPESEFVRQAAVWIREAGRGALTDQDLKERINQGLRAWIAETVNENRELFERFISETVKEWDPEATSRRIELHVGKDLQWIRINGTIVGGLAGLLIYFLSFIFRGLP